MKKTEQKDILHIHKHVSEDISLFTFILSLLGSFVAELTLQIYSNWN